MMENTLHIETGRELRFENLSSFRGKVKYSEINLKLHDFLKTLFEHGVNKNGPLITVTFGFEIIDGEQILDMELLIPIDKMVELPKEYKVKPLFYLKNAIFTRCNGDPINIELAYNELMKYIQNNNLHQITAGYNVNINDEQLKNGMSPIIDIYIGINPSIV